MRTILPFFLLISLSIGAQATPQLVLVLVHEGLTPQQLSGAIPHQAAWMLWKRVPLGEGDSLLPSRVVSFATGKHVAGEAEDGQLRLDSMPYESGTAREAFQRRTGISPPHPALLAMNAGGLIRRGLLGKTLGAKLERAGKRGLYLYTPRSPAPSPYALIGVGASGFLQAKEFPDFESLRIAIPTLNADWVLIEMARWDYDALELLMAEGIETWVVCLQPPDNGLDGVARLTALVRYAAREPSGLLTSPSTRWTGLILEVDFVPTLLQAIAGHGGDSDYILGAPAFESSLSDWHSFWNGMLPRTLTRALRRSIGLSGHQGTLERVEEHWRVHHELAPVLLVAMAGIGAGWVLSGLTLWYLGRLRNGMLSLYRVGLAVLVLFPAVSIWYSYCPFEIWTGDRAGDASVLVGWLMAGWVLFALGMTAIARWVEMPLLSAAGVIMLSVILLDTYIGGGYGINRSLLTVYLWEGARLYGLDNTYLGIVLPVALLAPAGWLESRARLHPGPRGMMALAAFYALLTLTFGLPMLGSNLGAWVPAILAFGLMLTSFQRKPFRPHLLIPILLLIGLSAMVFAIWLDAQQHWRLQSHFGRAWQSLMAGNLGVLIQAKWDVVTRVAFSLPLMVAVLGFGLLSAALWQWFRGLLLQLWYGMSVLRAAIWSAVWGAGAAILFNDSGLVTAAFIAGAVVVWLLDALVSRIERRPFPTNGHPKTLHR
jgi:hypothetical protein